MLQGLQQFFERRIAPRDRVGEAEQQLRLATAALFVEMMRADFEVTAEERGSLEAVVRDTLGIGAAEARELVELAEREVDDAVELFQFTRLIDRAFTPPEKALLVERLWRIAYADAEVDRLEEHLVRKIANLLHVSHRDYIEAKRRAREAVTEG